MSTPSKPRPTIKDVARACGVSEATVSYVINGKRVLKPDTREKVFRAMREMNYHPSAVARGLASKKVHTFGILLGAVDSIESMTNSYSSGLLTGIMVEAQREGFNITVFTAPWTDAATSAPALRDGRTDGILAIAPLVNTDILEGLAGLNMPLVVIAGAPHPGVSNVDIDNGEGMRLAVRHLAGLGHRRIAFISGNENMASYQPRLDGFHAAMAECGLEADQNLIQISRFDGSLATEQARELLSIANPPTAICAGNDAIAVGVLQGARELGISVPDQLSVVGFDDAPVAMMVTPNLTTIRQPLPAIGEAATRLLINFMRDPDTFEPESILVPPEIILRGTTAPPAK